MEIVKNGKFLPGILCDEDADLVVKNAVAELCNGIYRCTGITREQIFFRIPRELDSFIIVGSKKFAKQFGIEIPYETFQKDTAYIRVKDNCVVIDGGVRGKVYAVYEFLERFFGVRFYAPNETRTPHTDALEIADCEIVYTPPFQIRNIYSKDVRRDAQFCARVRINSAAVPNMLDIYGGSEDFYKPECHTTFKIFLDPNDPEIGFAKHPEYYSLDGKTGKRVAEKTYTGPVSFHGKGEICWTNEDVISIITEKLKKIIAENPERSIFSVSMNDFGPYCQCEKCKSIALQYGRDGQHHWIAPIMYCLNKVSKNIKQWQQENEAVRDRTVLIETLVYQYAVEPPVDMEIEDNILVRYCTNACYNHSFTDESCLVNSKQMRQLRDWNKLTDHIFIWDYALNFAMPLSYSTHLQRIQAKDQFFAENGVVGVFTEFTTSEVGPLYFVKQYLYARLLWDPYMDFEKELKDCMEYFYGKSAKYLLAVEDLVMESMASREADFLKNEDHLQKGYHIPVSYVLEKCYFAENFFTEGKRLFDKAMQEAETEKIRYRIALEKAYFDFTEAYLNRHEDMDALKQAVAVLDAFGVKNYRLESLKKHIYEGDGADGFFSDAVAESNRKRYYENLEADMYQV